MINVPLLLILAHLALLVAGIALLRRFTPRTPVQRALVAVLCGLAGLYTFVISEPLGEGNWLFADFRDVYYVAGRAALAGPSAVLPLLDDGVFGFTNLPVLAYLFAPFGMMQRELAALLFTLVGGVCVLASWLVTVQLARAEHQKWLLLFLFAAAGPLSYSVKEGNLSHIVLLFLVVALAALQRRRDAAAGVLLGLAALIKLPLLLFGLFLVGRRRWRAAAGFALTCGVAALASLALFGWDAHVTWYESSIKVYGENPAIALNVQSLHAFIVRFGQDPALLQNWEPYEAGAGAGALALAVALLVYLAAAAVCLRDVGLRAPGDEKFALEFMIVLTLAVVTSPLSWSHYYVWLLLPIALFLGDTPLRPKSRNGWAMVWLPAVLILLPLRFVPFDTPPMENFYMSVASSYEVVGGFLLLGLLLAGRFALGQPERRVAAGRRLTAG